VWSGVRSGELEQLVGRVKQQLRQLAITSSLQPARIFLGLDMTRAGYVGKDDLRAALIRHNLPCADDIVDCVRTAPSTSRRFHSSLSGHVAHWRIYDFFTGRRLWEPE